jgi:hypothetical protein
MLTYTHIHIQIFGIAPIYTWLIPVDPIFEDYDRVMGFGMAERLDREKRLAEKHRPPVPELTSSHSMDMPKCVSDLLPV